MTITVTGRSLFRISLIRSRPLIPGSRKSVSTSEHGCSTSHSSAAVPSVANRDLPVGKCEKLRKLLADQLAVIDHEDASFHGAFIRALAVA